jgi:hypothetical protein
MSGNINCVKNFHAASPWRLISLTIKARINMDKFLNHVFKKVCSEPRGHGMDALIKQSVVDNKEGLASLASSGQHAWIENIANVKALMLALDQLVSYYDGESISEEQWVLAGYYAYKHFELLDAELADSKSD